MDVFVSYVLEFDVNNNTKYKQYKTSLTWISISSAISNFFRCFIIFVNLSLSGFLVVEYNCMNFLLFDFSQMFSGTFFEIFPLAFDPERSFDPDRVDFDFTESFGRFFMSKSINRLYRIQNEM